MAAERNREQSARTPATRPEGRTPSQLSQRDNPFGFMRRFVEQMDSLFEDFGSGGGLAPRIQLGSTRFGQSAPSAWAPDIDVFEREGDFVIRADLPGMKREDIQVEMRDDALCISGERREEHERREEGGYYYTERSRGSFCRTIALPQGADTEKARASFHDGVLEVTVPVAPGRGARRIEIGESPTQGKQRAAS